MLNDLGDKTAIVFINTKKTADSLARHLDKVGYRVTTLHGGKTQEQREVTVLEIIACKLILKTLFPSRFCMSKLICTLNRMILLNLDLV